MKIKAYQSFLFFLLMNVVASAQYNSGEVTYAARMERSPIDISKADTEYRNQMQQDIRSLKQGLPQVKFTLAFNKDKAVFNAEEIMASDARQNREVAISFSTGVDAIYTDNKSKTTLQNKEIYGKKYLIEDSLQSFSWQITTEQKMIANYTCYKAEGEKHLYQKKKEKITAWFCPEIPFPFGPKGYGGLPGMILELDERGIVYYTEKLTFSKKKKKISLPKEGNRYTLEAYLKETDSIAERGVYN